MEVNRNLAAAYPESDSSTRGFGVHETEQDKKKVWMHGEGREHGEEVTRVYLATPTEHMADVYRDLVIAANDLGIAPNMDLALNLETLKEEDLPYMADNTIIAYFNRDDYESIGKFLQYLIKFVNENEAYDSIPQQERSRHLQNAFRTMTIPFEEGFIRVVEKEDGKSWDTTYGFLLKDLNITTVTSYNQPPLSEQMNALNNFGSQTTFSDYSRRTTGRRRISMPALLI
jgi:hypothetical protein